MTDPKSKSNPETPSALEYSRFPMWLNHPSLDPVIVYDSNQEAEYKAKGYIPPGTADPHAYLVAQVSGKLDDAIRDMNLKIERAIKDRLRELSALVTTTIQRELNQQRRHRSIQEFEVQEPIMDSGVAPGPVSSIDEMISNLQAETKAITSNAMDAVRQIATSTKFDG